MTDILIVDDDPAIRKLLTKRLERAGYEISIADNGKKCILKIAEYRPDLVILDVMMPMMGGLDVLKFIRKESDFQELPILMLTGRNDTDFIREIITLGVEDYVIKPLPPKLMDEFLLKIQKVFEKKTILVVDDGIERWRSKTRPDFLK